ncbi:hypothetical protein NL676_002422 [Syzygium grande]|nr:hypothetical protein NL676_002422 [Syzygium grande]
MIADVSPGKGYEVARPKHGDTRVAQPLATPHRGRTSLTTNIFEENKFEQLPLRAQVRACNGLGELAME